MFANIRLGWKWLALANTLAYNIKIIITAVKRFIVQVPLRGAIFHFSLKASNHFFSFFFFGYFFQNCDVTQNGFLE
jgi:hypothetical protein